MWKEKIHTLPLPPFCPHHIVAGKPELSLYAELTMRDKDEKMKVKIFTVSVGIKAQEASEMLLPGIMPETQE